MKNIKCLLIEVADVINVTPAGVVVNVNVKLAANAAEVIIYDGCVVKNRTGDVGKVVHFVSSTNVKVHTPLPATVSDETGVDP